MNTGIYIIENQKNGKQYVGSAVNLRNRLKHHFSRLRNGKHKNKHMQSAWDKHGEGAFSSRVLLICERKDLILYEQTCIDFYDAVKSGYNNAPIAGNTMGVPMSAERKAEQSAERIGIPMCAEHRLAHKAAMNSEEVKARISAGRRGIVPAKTAEHQAKITAKLIGRKVSDATKENLRLANLGQKKGPHSDATKAKIAEAQKGRSLKPDHVAALKAAWVRRKESQIKQRMNSMSGYLTMPTNDATTGLLRIA